jgi:hypothetical protein
VVDTIDEKSWTESTAGGKGTVEKVNSCSHCDLNPYIRTKGDASTADNLGYLPEFWLGPCVRGLRQRSWGAKWGATHGEHRRTTTNAFEQRTQ